MSLFGPILLAACALLPCPALAQFKDNEKSTPGGPKLSEKEEVQRIKVGLIVRADGGPVAGLYGTVPLPMDWPEQKVTVVDEEFSSPVKRGTDKVTDRSVKQLVVRIPQLKTGQTAKALVTLEIRRRAILPPDDTSGLSIPDKPDASLRVYLAPSPMIESTDKRIKQLAKDLLADKETDWQKVEALYDGVRSKVTYKNGPLKGALKALKDGTGDCEEMTSLFIAVCRASGIPARTVWVTGHCYPEFYLVDAKGDGHWFPCQAAGSRAFGGIPEHRPILQKGDNFRDPDRPGERMRYLSEHVTGKSFKGSGRPHVKFVRQDVATEKPLEPTEEAAPQIPPPETPDETESKPEEPKAEEPKTDEPPAEEPQTDEVGR
ncbi:MAG: transglutaminase domain-containing protein [Pirellulales bacterium]